MIYRTQVKIIADVLSATKDYSGEDGAGVTAIILRANLSYSRVAKILKDLVSAGLIEESFNGKVCKYRLSGKGEEFLQAYQKFEEFATSFGLRL